MHEFATEGCTGFSMDLLREVRRLNGFSMDLVREVRHSNGFSTDLLREVRHSNGFSRIYLGNSFRTACHARLACSTSSKI